MDMMNIMHKVPQDVSHAHLMQTLMHKMFETLLSFSHTLMHVVKLIQLPNSNNEQELITIRHTSKIHGKEQSSQ